MSRLGAPRLHLRQTDSTNTRARALASAGAPHGTLVTAAEQSAGRGRQGRAWSAPARSSLLMSIVVREPGPLLSLAAGVAVAETVDAVLGDGQVQIKWPNDIWLHGAKVAGILVEGRPQEGWAVVGIGLNVAVSADQFPSELAGRATGMGLSSADVEPVLARLLDALERWLGAEPLTILGAVRDRDALRGREVNWENGSGIAAGIDEHGALLVETGVCIARLDAGEVHLTL